MIHLSRVYLKNVLNQDKIKVSTINQPMPIKTVFFGTHEFASTILHALIQDTRFCIDLVITQPDKPTGRKQILTPPPTKLLAQQHGITVVQPQTLKTFHLDKNIYDIAITAQYGLLIPAHLFTKTKNGFINVHTSLLPKYRGASPIQSALINGETETGVSVMIMDTGMDTGPILSQEKITIDPHETYPELDRRLARIAALLLTDTAEQYIQGKIIPQVQDGTQATTCKKLSRADGEIDWSKTTAEIYNLYRGTTPWPGIWTTLDYKRVKLLKIKPAKKIISSGTINCDDKQIFIGTKDGSVEILTIQFEGKPAMDAHACTKGYKNILDNKKLFHSNNT